MLEKFKVMMENQKEMLTEQKATNTNRTIEFKNPVSCT